MARHTQRPLRLAVSAMCLVILVGCGSPTPIPPAPSPGQSLRSDTPAPSSEQPGSSDPTADPGLEPASDREPMPADIVSAIDAIVGASSPEAAIAATRVVLERSGIVVTDDPASALESMAGIYVPSAQLATMAYEAQSRAELSHVTFSEFAETFAGLALLPPNDHLLDLLAQPEASPDPSAPRLEINMDGQAGRLAAVLTSWVNRSLDEYPSEDPTMTALTMPALYLAELASRQQEPIELRETFLPSHLQLGSLDITLLVAGIRSALAVYEHEITGASSPLVAAAASVWDTTPSVSAAPADPTACGEVKRIIDAQAPLIADVFSFGSGEAIKAFVEHSVADVFESAAGFAKGIGAAFEALGVLFRIQALWLLYHNTELTLKIEPLEIHKPVGNNELAAAILTAGIPDAKWGQAIADRDNSPTATNLKACARSLGIPVTTDLVDVGEATSTWRVAWDITRGDAHAQFEGCQFIPSCDPRAVAAGRLERSLAKANDHSGQDTVILEIKPEEESDHPGREMKERVRVCAHLRTDKPPDVGTILNAGSAGVSGVTVGGIASLAASVSNILLSWWQFVFTLDKCAETTVSFHVPQAGNWRGTVTYNYELSESRAITSALFKGTYRSSLDVTDVIYVGGNDDGELPIGQSPIFVSLDARQYTRGGYVREDLEHRVVYGAGGCAWFEDTTFSMSGPINFALDDKTGSVQIEPDGRYRLSVHRGEPEEEILLPFTETVVITDNGSVFECEGFGTEVDDGDLPVTSRPEGLVLEGTVDLANPELRLKGRVTSTDFNGGITTVEWDLTRDPVPVPSPQ